MKPVDLTTLAEMMAGGKIKSVIDRTYRISEVPEAIRYLDRTGARKRWSSTLTSGARPRNSSVEWRARTDSNRRPPGSKPSALSS